MAVETYDLLNNLVADGRIRNVTVSAYVINEVQVLSFLKDNVKISPNTKFVQVRTLSIKEGVSEKFMEAVLYASVPLDAEIGSLCFLKGSLAPISKESYSKECSIFKFRKSGGEWWLDPIEVIPWSRNPFTDKTILANLNYWRNAPLTLTTGVSSIVQPVTRMFETEVLFSLSTDLYAIQDEYDVQDFNFDSIQGLTRLQAQVLSEMMVYPVVQFRVEDEVFLTNADLAKAIRSVAKDRVVLLDIRSNPNNALAVLRTLEKQGKFMDGKSYWVLCKDFVEGIPSVLIGKECLL